VTSPASTRVVCRPQKTIGIVEGCLPSLRAPRAGVPKGGDYVNFSANQVGLPWLANRSILPLGPAVFNCNVLAYEIASVLQPLKEGFLAARSRASQSGDSQITGIVFLRPGGERPSPGHLRSSRWNSRPSHYRLPASRSGQKYQPNIITQKKAGTDY